MLGPGPGGAAQRLASQPRPDGSGVASLVRTAFCWLETSLFASGTHWSPWAHLHVVGMLRFMSLTKKQPSLPTPFYSVLVSVSVFMALSTVFHSINSPDNKLRFLTLFFLSYLCLVGPFNYFSLYESLLQPRYNPFVVDWA